MRNTGKRRKTYFLPLMILLLAAALSGCGHEETYEASEGYEKSEEIEEKEDDNNDSQQTVDNAGNQELTDVPDDKSDVQTDEADADASDEKTDGEQNAEPLPELTEEELASLRYVEKIAIEDYYGDHAEYEAYVPIDTENEDGFAYSFVHGLTYSGSAFNMESTALMQEYMNGMVDFDKEFWNEKDSGYSEIEFGDVVRCGDDRYRIATAMKEDYYGTPYAVKKVYFMDQQGQGAGVVWSLELSEIDADDETDAVIDEMARCYRVNLDVIKSSGDWQAGDAERREQQQDVYEPGAGELVLEPVDGYRYMGLTMISDMSGAIQCPVMLPMGWRTSVQEYFFRASMHGVAVSGDLTELYSRDFLSTAQSNVDSQYGTYERITESYANPQATKLEPIGGYDMARYAVITYDEWDYSTEEFLPRVKVMCFIRVRKDYILDYSITLSFEDYDDATDTLIKELEVAYGIDLSEYYYENVR